MSRPGPQARLAPGWTRSSTGQIVPERGLAANGRTASTAGGSTGKKGVWDSYKCENRFACGTTVLGRVESDLHLIDLRAALSPRTRIYIGSAVFVFAGAALYFEPLIFPEPETLRKAPGPKGDVLIDAKDGERLPVGLRVVDRKVTKWD